MQHKDISVPFWEKTMKILNIVLDSKNHTSKIVTSLKPLILGEENVSINLKTSKYNNLMQAILLVSAVNNARANGYQVEINCESINEYLQRINFYTELGIDIEEKFKRHNRKESLLEICNVNDKNSIQVVDGIMRILQKSTSLDQNVLSCLNYCFWEMIDNIQEHAKSKIGGYVVVQNYPKKNNLEIDLVDTGRGIRASLSENAKFADISEAEALQESIKEGMTRGTGRGNGLFHTTNFVKENDGTFWMHSGNHMLEVVKGRVKTFEVPFWDGTAIHLRVKTNNDVLLENIFGDEKPITVEEYNESINGLW